MNGEKMTLRSVESTQAGHSRGCTGTLCLLGIKQFPEHKKHAGGDQPSHPTVKYSLGMGENNWQQLCTVAPVKLNRMATAKERVLAQGPFAQKYPKFCHLLWHLNSCFACIHDSNPY